MWSLRAEVERGVMAVRRAFVDDLTIWARLAHAAAVAFSVAAAALLVR